MAVLYDVDLDFFLDSERPLTECFTPKKLAVEPKALWDRCRGVPARLHLEHVEALVAWDGLGLKGWECWHFDAHLDCGPGGAESPLSLPLGRRADHVHSGNFLLAALREGLFEAVHWVLPPWMSPSYAQWSLDQLEPPLAARIRLSPWAEAREALPPPDGLDISFSPSFVPLELLKEIADFLPAEERELDFWLDRLLRVREAALSGVPETPLWLADAPVQSGAAVMFHGSNIAGLGKLAGTPLFLSPSPAVACCFGLPLSSERGWVQGVDHLVAAFPRTYIVVPPGEEDYLKRPMTLYAVRASESCRPDGNLIGYEYSSPEEHEVIYSRPFARVQDALAEYGVEVGRPGENRLGDWVKARPPAWGKKAERFLEMTWAEISALSALEASLMILRAGWPRPPEGLTVWPPVIWRRWLDRVLLPAVRPFFLNQKGPWHGLDHARQTARLAGFLAWQAGISPLAPMLAACLHDAARTGEELEPEHAATGAELAKIFLKHFAARQGPFLKTGDIVKAVARHNRPGRTAHKTGAFLRDADRLRLAWAEGVKRGCFSTARGLKLAELGSRAADNYLTFYENLGETAQAQLEIKFELTRACNLNCSFCHQGFGRRHSAGRLEVSVFADYLNLLAREGLQFVRLTGGEPLLLPDLADYLALAKRKGLSTTLNTNALLLTRRKIKDLAPNLDCLKISLPAPDSAGLTALGYPPGAWEKKLEAAGLAAAYQVRVEFLTPMFPEAISRFDEFKRLLDPLPSFGWLPLRAEPGPGGRRPVKREEMRRLLDKVAEARSQERWSELQVFLAAPFCLLSSPSISVVLLNGRRNCGPFSSLVVDSAGRIFRCYSRRQPLRPARGGLRELAILAAWEDFEALPELCWRCPVVYRCLGGCRCRTALGPGGLDYLADPDQAARWLGNT